MELFCILVRSVSYLQVLQDLLVLSAAIMLSNVAAVNAQVSVVALASLKGCDSAGIRFCSVIVQITLLQAATVKIS